MRLALSLGQSNGALDTAEEQRSLAEFDGMIRAIRKRMRARLRSAKKRRLAGICGICMSLQRHELRNAQEGQLKLMETMCIPTMFNDIGEFSHGMHRSIERGSSVC